LNNADFERVTRDWVDVEKWLVMNTQVEPQRWFRALDISQDLNLDESYVDSFLSSHFESESLERRWEGDRYTYRNFQYRYKVKSQLKHARLNVSVEAPRDEIFSAVHQVMNTLAVHQWDCVAVNPPDYNDYDKPIEQVELTFEWQSNTSSTESMG